MKTEWEKMQEGEIYNDFDRDLFNRRVEAKKLFRRYNKTDDSETHERDSILRQLFKSVGKNLWIEPDFRCEFGKNISIGNDVYINFGCVILDCGEVSIGNEVLIGPNVGLYDANHALDAQERMDGALIPGNIRIGNRVWIGGGTIILPNVTIGDDTVIGAGSIVTHSIPSGVVAVGNPCRVLREITQEDKLGYKNISATR
jgi:maltose O-acetyltransferase